MIFPTTFSPSSSLRVCIMHNVAHHRISISSLCTRREKSFCIEKRRERALLLSLQPRLRLCLSLASNRHRQRLQEGDESDDTCAKVKMYGPRAREPTTPPRATLVKEILIIRYAIEGGTRDAEGPLISSRCHFVKRRVTRCLRSSGGSLQAITCCIR